MMKRSWKRGFFCAALLVASGIPAETKMVNRILAVVNDDVITQYDLDRAIAPSLNEIRRAGNSGIRKEEMEKQILDGLIHQKLLEQEIHKAHIEVSDEELARAIAGVLQKNQITIETLKAELSQKGVPFEDFKGQISGEIRQAKFIQQNLSSQIQISEEEIENFKSRLEKETPEEAKRDGTLASADDLKIQQILYNERMEEEISNYFLRLRRKAFVEIRE